MKQSHQLSQVIISCWRLGEDSGEIPTSHGLLDRGLRMACEKGALPDWARQQLHFVDSRIGLQCVELPAILDSAQRAELTEAPNSSYKRTVIKISPQAARQIVKRLNISPEQAADWGRMLGEAVGQAEKQFEEHVGISAIEDY